MELIRRSIFQCKACGSTPLRRAILRSFSSKATGSKYVEEHGKKWPKRVVSGLQPTGSLHLGNYFGAVKRCVDLQNSGQDLTLFIANLHALTPGKGVNTEHVDALSAQLLAAGVCPERSVFFIQSMVPRHAELCWILTCTASYARVAQLHGFKTCLAAAGEQGAVPLGILLYPVLQAADVLVHRATHVPVGADQIQHLQLAANLAKTFTSRYGPVFPTPRPLIADEGTGSERIRSLRDPSKKMSKSDPHPKSCILLTDTDEQIQLKIRKSVTDCNPQVTYEPETRPGVSNLVSLHCLCEDLTPEEAVELADGLTTFQYKSVVARAVCAAVAPVRDRIEKLLADKERLNAIMRHGAARARISADEVYDEVCEKVGLAPRRTVPLSAAKKNVKAKAVKEKVSLKA